MKKAILSLLVFGAVLSAAPVSVSYVGPNSKGLTTNINGENAYVGPYTLDVNGHDILAMCIDDKDLTQGSWSANVTVANSSDLSKTYQPGFANVYKAESYLFSQILKPSADIVDIQLAAWAYSDGNEWIKLSNDGNQTALNYVKQANQAVLNGFDDSGYEILSDVNVNAGPGHREQEFITATPEPASFAMLGGGLVLAGLSRFVSRRKKIAEVAA